MRFGDSLNVQRVFIITINFNYNENFNYISKDNNKKKIHLEKTVRGPQFKEITKRSLCVVRGNTYRHNSFQTAAFPLRQR